MAGVTFVKVVFFLYSKMMIKRLWLNNIDGWKSVFRSLISLFKLTIQFIRLLLTAFLFSLFSVFASLLISSRLPPI